MISVAEVVADEDMQAPQPFTILRSVGTFISGGFQSVTTPISAYGPVQRASEKEVQMLPEADRVGGIMAFWWTEQMFVTRGKAPLPSTHGEVPDGVFPGIVYTLSGVPPADSVTVFKRGLFMTPGIDYNIDGNVITFTTPTQPTDTLYVTWPITAAVGNSAADILVYPGSGGERYRVLAVKHYPGSGYYKALGTRMSAI